MSDVSGIGQTTKELRKKHIIVFVPDPPPPPLPPPPNSNPGWSADPVIVPIGGTRYVLVEPSDNDRGIRQPRLIPYDQYRYLSWL